MGVLHTLAINLSSHASKCGLQLVVFLGIFPLMQACRIVGQSCVAGHSRHVDMMSCGLSRGGCVG